MQFSSLALLAIVAHLTSAQVTVADLPSCALTPALSAIGSTGCSATDIACVCKDTAFITQLTAAVQTACSAADQAKTITVAQGLCSQAGVTLTVPGSGSSSAAPAPSTSSVASDIPSSIASSMPVATPSSVPTPLSNGSISVTASPTPSATFTGAAASFGSYAGAGLLGLVAMFAL